MRHAPFLALLLVLLLQGCAAAVVTSRTTAPNNRRDGRGKSSRSFMAMSLMQWDEVLIARGSRSRAAPTA